MLQCVAKVSATNIVQQCKYKQFLPRYLMSHKVLFSNMYHCVPLPSVITESNSDAIHIHRDNQLDS